MSFKLKQGDRWFLVDVQRICIDAGSPDITSLQARMDDIVKRGDPPGAWKIMSKPAVGGVRLDPKDPKAWEPKRANPSRENRRLYHVVVKNDRHGKKTYMTRSPVSHVEAVTIMNKMAPRRDDSFVTLEEATSSAESPFEESYVPRRNPDGAECTCGLENGPRAVERWARERCAKHASYVLVDGQWQPSRSNPRRNPSYFDRMGYKAPSQAPRERVAVEVKRRAPSTFDEIVRSSKPGDVNWFFNWTSGGYHSVMASSKQEALRKATAMGQATRNKLVPDADTLVEDADYSITNRENERWRNNPSRRENPGELLIVNPERPTRGSQYIAAELNTYCMRKRDPTRSVYEVVEVHNGGGAQTYVVLQHCKTGETSKHTKVDFEANFAQENPSAEPGERGMEVFEMWHKKQPKRISTKRPNVGDKEELVSVGRAFSIVYKSGKWEKGRKTNDYIHHFDSKPKVWMLAAKLDGGGGTKTVGQILRGAKNADGQFEVAELAVPESLCLDNGTSEGEEIQINSGAKVYGAIDQRTVIIYDPHWRLIVIKGGQMTFDERGIVK